MATATEKATVFRDFLSRGDAQLMFDARRAGVVVPDDMVTNSCMRLLFALNRKIKNFVIDDVKGVSAVLRFESPAGIVEEIPVSIPWWAVYGIVDDKNMLAVWGSDVPSDVQLSGRKRDSADADLQPDMGPVLGEKRIEINLGRLRH